MLPQIKATQNEAVLSRRVGDEYLVMHRQLKQYHVLNETAALIWELAGHGRVAPEIANEVAVKFGVGLHEVEQDVLDTLQGLSDLKLVVLSEGY